MVVFLKNHQRGTGEGGIQGIAHQGRRVFLLYGGEAVDWLDCTVRVPTLHAPKVDQWIDEFQKLASKNQQLMPQVEPPKSEVRRKPRTRSNRPMRSVSTKNACCSSPASIEYWLGATVVAWALLSLIGLIYYPLHATSAITVLFAMAAGCFANWIRNRTYHCFVDGPLFLVAGALFLFRAIGIVRFPSWAVWFPLFAGVLISFWLEWRTSWQRQA